MSTKKKGQKSRKNKTAKQKEWRPKLFHFKHQGSDGEIIGKNGSKLRIETNKISGKVRAKVRHNWPDDILTIFDSLENKWPRGGPVDPRLGTSDQKSQKPKKKTTKKKTTTSKKKTTKPKKKTPKKNKSKPQKKAKKQPSIIQVKDVGSENPISEKKIESTKTPTPDTPTPSASPVQERKELSPPKSISPLDVNSKLTIDYTTECSKLIDEIEHLHDLDINSDEYQSVLKCLENKNKNELINQTDEILYPHLDDPNFTLKLTKKKEFNDVKIQKKTQDQINNIGEEADRLCKGNIEFELEPHQMFVRNFLSFETPYKSLLIFHGLGTGKTCSSITVCEEMRSYYKQLGINKKIMIIASPTVQENYMLQLFDERKLKRINGLWNIKACTGNKFIKEVNPMNMKGLTRDKIVKQIKKIIRQSYEFMGYIEFANKIDKLIKKINVSGDNDRKRKRKINVIRREFSNRLLVIDEVHNIRALHGSKRRTTQNMLDLVTYVDNMKMLLLTATPMFNDAMEIIWLLNLMNLNDKRFPLKISDVFNLDGSFVKSESGENIGKQLLIQKLIGYVSYVSGENPFTFPYRIWPWESANPHSLKKLLQDGWNYPTTQVNGLEITEEMRIRYLDLVITKLSDDQQQAYDYIISREKEKNPILNEPRQGVKYTVIDGPLQALNMIYPHRDLDNPQDNIEKYLYGGAGLNRVMEYTKSSKKRFSYVSEIEKQYGRLFSSSGENPPLKRYSSKIYGITKKIKESEGIVLIYSQYIDGGCVPIALALEEMGITRYGDRQKSLFTTPPTEPMKINGKKAKYIMITGDKLLSPGKNNKMELKVATHPDNINGEKVKVIIISKAGSEGLDFRNIRQVHILEPWYNMNRADQIIGRGVRNKSHCDLPYSKRTVEIFLYGSELDDPTQEAIDLYVYRLAEYKALRIGIISRILKENATDCLININQQDMIADKMNKTVQLTLSNNKTIKFKVGYKNNSIICDFMNCNYNCSPNESTGDGLSFDTYSENYIVMNLEKILQRIKQLFKEHYIYEKSDLIKRINAVKFYSSEQINMALHVLITDKNEYLSDMLNRNGRLVNIANYYLFQPINLDDKYLTHFERKNPIDYKATHMSFKLPKRIKLFQTDESKKDDKDMLDILRERYNILSNPGKITKKRDWIQTGAWAIDNLVKYNNLDKTLLLKFGLEHLFDILTIDKKIEVLNKLYQKKEKNTFDNFLLEILNKFTVSKDPYKGFACANYFKRIIKNPKLDYTILVYNTDKTPAVWEAKTPSISSSIKLEMIKKIIKKFKINDLTVYNPDVIGFLTKHGSNIVFKTKIPRSSRKSKGIQCPSAGENRTVTMSRLNNILQNIKPEIKYKLNNKKTKTKRVIHSIYGNTDIEQIFNMDEKNVSSKNIAPITDVQMCIETELALRYLDEIGHDDKRWFLSTLEDTINDIKNLRI